MTELEKLKMAFDVFGSWRKLPPTETKDFADWIQVEIARLEDPFAQAKHKLHGWSQSETTTPGTWNLIHYVEHLKSDRDHYKIQCEHAKQAAEEWKKASGPVQIKTDDGWREAAAEPLDPERVLATTEEILKSRGESFAAECVNLATRQAVGVKGKPYEVKNDRS